MRRPLLALAAACALTAGVAAGPSATAASPVDPLAYGFQGEGGIDAPDGEFRTGTLLPTAAQTGAVAALGARATWGPLGSPLVVTRDDAGYLSGPAEGAPADIARAWVRDNAAIFGLTPDLTTPARLEVLVKSPLAEGPQLRAKMAGQPVAYDQTPYAVTFQQVFDGAPTGLDGLLTVAIDAKGRVVYASANTIGDTRVTNTAKISMVDAYLAAAKNAYLSIDRSDVELLSTVNALGHRILKRDGVADQQLVRLVTVPTPRDGVRLAYEVVVLRSTTDGVEHPHAYQSMVDAETGEVLSRHQRLQHADDTEAAPGAVSVPYWRVFPGSPLLPRTTAKAPDTRVYWCFAAGSDCAKVLGTVGGKPNPAGKTYAYDQDLTENGVATTTFTTDGNNARTAISRFSQLTPDTFVPATPSPGRTYDYAFQDQWHTSGCNPANFLLPGLNDADASTANLFVMHNRMHDWGYYLGWTPENSNLQKENVGSEANSEARENDPEIGNAQSGSASGGATFLGRDNANQVTLQDGTPGITNQYLWEPLQAGFYPPCADGAYDMGIIAHEVGHAISNRMTAGPNTSLSGHQAGAMGESWSDLMAVEYLNGYGYTPVDGESTTSVAAYAIGDGETGIRNYNMADSPLNFSDVEYDGNGVSSPHADGEIWSATQFQIRKEMNAKYDALGFDSGNKALQTDCADGVKVSTVCPGNRRWMQLLFDGYLLQPGATSMLTSRDAIIAADKARYGGANTELLWKVFAQRGMGIDAEAASAADLQPVADFKSPLSKQTSQVTFKATVAGAAPEAVNVYVGDYEARVTPVAVLENGKTVTRSFEPGTYRLIVQAEGFGHRRMTVTIKPGGSQTVTIPLRKNLASVANGAEVSGDGADGGEMNLNFIADDTERTNWASIADGNVIGKQVTVALGGGAQTVREVQVSAANRPTLCEAAGSTTEPTDVISCEESREAPYDTGGQNRFATLRSFEVLACDTTTGKECTDEADFTSVLVKRDAFPADRPRPTAPDINLRTFPIPDTKATHVRIKVLDNQCTGGPEYTAATNPENNPLSAPDCANGALTTGAAPGGTVSRSQAENVRISELQVFGSRIVAAPAAPPVAGPPVAKPPVVVAPEAPTLPTTGGLPLALGSLVLLAVAGAVHRSRRSA